MSPRLNFKHVFLSLSPLQVGCGGGVVDNKKKKITLFVISIHFTGKDKGTSFPTGSTAISVLAENVSSLKKKKNQPPHVRTSKLQHTNYITVYPFVFLGLIILQPLIIADWLSQ